MSKIQMTYDDGFELRMRMTEEQARQLTKLTQRFMERRVKLSTFEQKVESVGPSLNLREAGAILNLP